MGRHHHPCTCRRRSIIYHGTVVQRNLRSDYYPQYTFRKLPLMRNRDKQAQPHKTIVIHIIAVHLYPPPHIQTNHAGLALPTMLPSHHDPTTMKNINFLPARSSRQSSRTSNSLRGTLTPNSLLPTYPTHSFHPPMLQINHLSPGPPSR